MNNFTIDLLGNRIMVGNKTVNINSKEVTGRYIRLLLETEDVSSLEEATNLFNKVCDVLRVYYRTNNKEYINSYTSKILPSSENSFEARITFFIALK